MTTFDWSAVAPAWEKTVDSEWRHGVEAVTSKALLDRMDIAAGQRVLELGAGAGDLGLRLAELVGSNGELVLTDVAAGMVDILQRRTLGIPHVTVAQVDASATQFPDSSFERVVFCMGLMFVPDPVAATKELHRIVRSGGRVGIQTWAAPEHNPWLLSVGMAANINGLVSGGPPTQPGGVFSLGHADQLREVLIAGGFTDVDVVPVDVEFRAPDFDSYFDTVSSLAGPLAAVLAAATPEQLAAVRSTALELARPYAKGEGFALPGRALLAIAS